MNDLKHQTRNLAAWTRNPPWSGRLHGTGHLLDFEMQVDLPQSSDQRHPWPSELGT